MTEERSDQDHLDERIIAMAREVSEPPPVPRERIWASISARRAEAKVIPLVRARPRGPRTIVWIGALAASLLLGIALDRGLLRPDPAPTPAGVVAAEPTAALQLATTQHLSQVETLLTRFRIEEVDTLFRAQARELLTSTRFLIDNPGLQDSRIRGLLQDLELILVQLVQPGAAVRPGERDLIADGLEQRNVLPRLRSQIPSGPPHLGAS